MTRPFQTGIAIACSLLLPFSRLTFDREILELSGSMQFIIVCLCLSSILGWQVFWLGIRPVITRGLFWLISWILALMLSLAFSVALEVSFSRLVLATVPAVLVFLIATMENQNVQKVIEGFATALAFILVLSIVWAVIGLVGFWYSPSELPLAGWHVFGHLVSQSTGQRVFSVFDNDWVWMRFAGFFPNPNGLGIMTMTGLFLSPFIGPKWRSLARGVLIVGIVITFSRTALIFGGIAACWLAFSRFSHLRQLYASVAVFSVFLLPFLLSGSWMGFLDEWLYFAGLTNQESLQLGERGKFMQVAVAALPDHWLTGAGFGQATQILYAGNEEMALHSVVLTAWLETGVIGVVVLAGMWLWPVWANPGQDSTSSGASHVETLTALLLGLFVCQVFDLSVTRFHYIHLMLFLFLGLISIYDRQRKRG